MDVLHVSPSFGMGGREMRAATLMGMMPAGTRHHVIALDGRTECLDRVAAGVDVRVIRDTPPTGGLPTRIRAMRRLLAEHRSNLLLTYNWGSTEWLLAARLEKLRAVIHHEDGFGSEEVDRLLRRRIWLRRAVFPVCSAVVVPSRTLFEIGRRRWRQPSSRLRYLPNGVDLLRFQPPASARTAGEVVFGCVGRISPEKNVGHAIEAFSRAKCRDRARLRVVGDGSERAAAEQLAAARGVADRVDFIGSVSDTAPEYRAMDVFVIPSTTEQMPLALLEAMASGLPVVGTDVGDVRNMVSELNQDRIDAAHLDPAKLAAALDEIAAEPATRAALGAANRSKVESEFDLDVCYGAYVSLYVEVHGRGGR